MNTSQAIAIKQLALKFAEAVAKEALHEGQPSHITSRLFTAKCAARDNLYAAIDEAVNKENA